MRHLKLAALWLLLLLVPLQGRAQEGQGSTTPPASPASPPASAPQTVRTTGVPRDQCFPLERLPANLRPRAEAMLLTLLDSEGLFTVIGGIKPMSSGYVRFQIQLTSPDTAPLEEARQILQQFRCGDAYTAELLPFHRTDGGKRHFEAVFFHRPALGEAIRLYAPFFAPFGISASSDPLSVALIIEHDQTTARNRGLGYLFGYPKHAVDFFVTAADEEKRTRKFVQRDFINIPTFVSEKNRFVYAVPRGYRPAPEDEALKAKARRILDAYQERRARYIGEGKAGVVALLRDWMDDGTGQCSPENARY